MQFAFFNELLDEERFKNTWFGAFFLPKWNFDQEILETEIAHSFSAVCAHDVFEQFFRWTLVANVDPSVKAQRDAL